MKLKKILSVMLASCLLCATVPVASLPASAATITWKANKINSNSYAEKDAILFTPDFGGNTLPSATYHDYSWWKVIVCDYDYTAGAYKVISVNLSVGSGYPKTAIIPKNGFVIADCASESSNAISGVKVGDTAYLYLSGASSTVTFGGKGSGTPHTPKAGLNEVKTNLQKSTYTTASLSNGFTLKIDNYDVSANYYIMANDSSACSDGVVKLAKTRITGATHKLSASAFGGARLLTVYVWAEKGGACSPVTRSEMLVFSDSALKSQLGEKKVVAFGDSLTAFTGWVKSMLTEIGTDVINSGVGGDTSAMGRARFKTAVLDHKPDVCIINFGMNDQAKVVATGKSNIPVATYKANIEYFIKELQKIGCYVVLVTPHSPYEAPTHYKPGGYGLNYNGGYMPEFCEAVRSLAKQYNCGLVDINTLSANENKANFTAASDGIHCSQYGHSKYLQWISSFLIKQFATAGDFNGDGTVNNTDLAQLKNNIGSGTDDTTELFDFNRNNKIDIADYIYLKRCINGNGELKWTK